MKLAVVSHYLDCSGHLCPVPVIMTEEKIEELAPGEVLEVLFTDLGARADLEAWCKATGNVFLEYRGEKFKGTAKIRKKK